MVKISTPKKDNKLIALLIVLVILISEICLIPSNILADSKNLENQNKATNNKYVNFDTYFINDGKNLREVEIKDESIGAINFELNVENGYLKNASIAVQDPNFSMQKSTNEIIESLKDNVVQLKEINGSKIITMPILMDKKDIINLNYLNKVTKVVLSGIFVSDNGKEQEIKKEMLVKVKWNLNVEINLTSNITNFIPSENKTLIQEKINIKETERKNPIQETKIYVSAPKLNNILPENVRVVANSLQATNGDIYGINFTKDNYKYDENTGNLEITVSNNADENGNIAFYNGADEYVITYIYNQKFEEILKQNVEIDTYSKAEIKFYQSENLNVTQNSNKYNLKNAIGDNVTAEIYSVSPINKGFLYDNFNETIYDANYKLNINNQNANKIINLNTLNANFANNEKEYETNEIYYKSLAVKEAQFNKILGEEGFINIYDVNNNLISTINKKTNKNNNGELEITYSEKQPNIRIEISTPRTEGVLELRNTKTINSKLKNNINQLKEFNAINERININGEYKGSLKLEETYTKVDLQMDNTKWMPFIDNNVNFTLNLVTNNNSYDLFKNPEIRITLPEEVENITIGEVSLIYNTELKLEYARLEENNRVLVLKLAGEETNYKLGIQEGTKIIIPAVIKLKNTVSTQNANLKMTYTNELAKNIEYKMQGKESVEVPVNMVAKSGLITITTLSGHNGNEQKLALDENIVTGSLQIAESTKVAKVESEIVNNYQTEIKDVVILGKIPFANNKTLSGKELGSTFTATLKEWLKLNGITGKIYYSEEEEPNEDSTSWKEDVSEFTNIKNFKIIPDINIAVGNTIKFEYNIEIPAELKANLKSYATYTIKYSINGQGMEATQTIGFETPNVMNVENVENSEEAGINMKVKTRVGDEELKENSKIHEQEIINYEIEVTNNSNNTVQNISIKSPIAENTVYVEKNENPYESGEGDSTEGNYIGVYKEIPEKLEEILEIGTLNKGESKTVEYEVRVKDLPKGEENKTISSNIALLINNKEQSNYKLNTIVQKAELKAEIPFMKRTAVVEENNFTYNLRIENKTSKDLKDLTVTMQIPKEVKVTNPKAIENGIGGIWQEGDKNLTIELNKNNLITCQIHTLGQGQIAQLEFLAEVTELKGVNNSINISANIFVNNETYRSNISKNILEGAEVIIEKSSPTEGQEVREWDNITYNIKVTNKSDKIDSQIYVIDRLPKEVLGETLKYNQYIYDFENKTYIEIPINMDLSVVEKPEGDQTGTDTSKSRPKYDKETNELKIPTMLPPGKTINIEINTTVQKIEQDITLSNIANVYGEAIISNTSNEINHYAKKENTNKPVDPEKPEENTYSISGTIWEDTNVDGAMDSKEAHMEGLEVLIVNSDTSEVVKDLNGVEVKAISDKNGYTLSGLKPGRYIVIFRYDNNIYKITNYKQEGVSGLVNSKAISGQATIDGNKEFVGMTDVIEITDSNVTAINMGLIKLGNFDIGIEKTIDTVNTVDSKGRKKEHKYKDGTKLGKLEVSARSLVGTKVYVNYKIKVTNKGETKGYVEQIIDELPSDLTFEKSLNQSWYEENGKIYNSTINELEVGQSKELILTLTKKLTNENLGITNNIALFKASNENSSKDINEENNKSNAQLIIGTSTGRIVLNITGMLALLAIIVVGIFIIKKYK